MCFAGVSWFLSRLGGRFAALPPCGFGFRLSDCGRFFRLLVCVALPSVVPDSVPWSRLGFVSGPDPVLVGPISGYIDIILLEPICEISVLLGGEATPQDYRRSH